MKNVLEIVSFKVKDGIDTESFLRASADMEKSFAKKQDGFIRRTLAKAEGDEYVDIVYWETMEAATRATEAAMKSTACAPFFGMIDEASIKMSHYTVQE